MTALTAVDSSGAVGRRTHGQSGRVGERSLWQITGGAASAATAPHKKIYHHLYFQVLCAIVLGVLVGYFYPQFGESLKSLGDGFIKLIKMLIAPIIFCTVVHGIASMEDMKKVGRVGIKALIYFEVDDDAGPDRRADRRQPVAARRRHECRCQRARHQGDRGLHREGGRAEHHRVHLHIVPTTVVGAFAEGEILQVLFFALLFGFALYGLGERGKPLLGIIDQTAHVFFKIVGIVMKVAPIGAFGAMAFTIGKYGVGTLVSLGQLMLAFYATCLIFVFLVLGTVARLRRLQHHQVHQVHQGRAADRARHLVLGVGAAAHDRQDGEAGLRQVGRRAGHPDRLLVQPRRHLHLPDDGGDLPGPGDQYRPDPEQQLGIIGVLLLTSKGAAGVTGSGFIVLAATLASVGTIPVASIALILGIDRFMSEARALTNLIGNGVATIVVAKWEGALDTDRMHRHLNNETDAEADEPGGRAGRRGGNRDRTASCRSGLTARPRRTRRACGSQKQRECQAMSEGSG